MSDNTQDLSKFGYRELDMAADLLKALANSPPDFLEDGITLEFNPNSGSVFIYDNEFNTAMMNGDKLEQWFYCHECGAEGFKEDFNDDSVAPAGTHNFDNGYLEHTESES